MTHPKAFNLYISGSFYSWSNLLFIYPYNILYFYVPKTRKMGDNNILLLFFQMHFQRTIKNQLWTFYVHCNVQLVFMICIIIITSIYFCCGCVRGDFNAVKSWQRVNCTFQFSVYLNILFYICKARIKTTLYRHCILWK